MSDVLITPASKKIEFFDASSNIDGKIELDASDNLVITNAGGDIIVGDSTSDIFVGDGVTSVDIVFEQSGEIRGTGTQTITLGTSGDTVAIGSGVTFTLPSTTLISNLNADLLDGEQGSSYLRSNTSDTYTGTLTIGSTSGDATIAFPDISTSVVPDAPTNQQYDYITFGASGSISQVSGRGALMIASADDALVLSNGDVGRGFTSSEINVGVEDTFLLSDFAVRIYTDLQNAGGTGWPNAHSFAFNNSGQLEIDVATGTAPLSVSSTTVVTNLNADLLDGVQLENLWNIGTGAAATDRSYYFYSGYYAGLNAYFDSGWKAKETSSNGAFVWRNGGDGVGLQLLAQDGSVTAGSAVTFDGEYRWRDGEYYTGTNKFWHAGNDGSGSGLDADLLDGEQGSSYLRSNADDTYTGDLTHVGGAVFGSGTLTGNGQNDIFMFATSPTSGLAQSGAFRNKLRILGGSGQSRDLQLYQQNSEYAHIGSSWTSNQLTIDSAFTRVNFNQTIVASANVHITGSIRDSSGDYGTSGQVLSSTGTGIDWITAGSGTVTSTGGADNRIAVFTATADEIEGDANFTWDGSSLGIVGNITASGTITSTSDARVKTDVEELTNSSDILNQLRPISYKRKDEETDRKQYGLIAQEVLDVLPSIVHGSEEDGYKLSYIELIAHLIEGYQSLEKKMKENEKVLNSIIDKLKN